MCDNGYLFCFCDFCTKANETKVKNLFFHCIKELLVVNTPHIVTNTQNYRNVVSKLIKETNLVFKMDRSVVMKKFSQMIDAHPFLTYKEAFDCLFVSTYDPIIRLKFDDEYRDQFVDTFVKI